MVTGYLFDSRFLDHNPGTLLPDFNPPIPHFEHPATKERLHEIIESSGLLKSLVRIPARLATWEELSLVHTHDYLSKLESLNTTGGDAVEEAPFSPGGFEIARLAAGGCLNLAEALISGEIQNGYALVRPPGHHAEPDRGRGFCLLANVGIVCRYLQSRHGLKKIAIVDYDVHHGNGTQKIFFKDPSVLFISIHQDGNYPVNEGFVSERGGFNVNIPLPAGSGSGAYQTAFDEVILPALDKFQPELILVSSGFDASGYDPLAQMMLTSEDYQKFAQKLLSKGKCLFFHEGGYSEAYVPYCRLRVLETLSGIQTGIVDPLLFDISQRRGQKLQHWQRVVIDDSKLMY